MNDGGGRMFSLFAGLLPLQQSHEGNSSLYVSLPLFGLIFVTS
jgi:hypothetical protein